MWRSSLACCGSWFEAGWLLVFFGFHASDSGFGLGLRIWGFRVLGFKGFRVLGFRVSV